MGVKISGLGATPFVKSWLSFNFRLAIDMSLATMFCKNQLVICMGFTKIGSVYFVIICNFLLHILRPVKFIINKFIIILHTYTHIFFFFFWDLVVPIKLWIKLPYVDIWSLRIKHTNYTWSSKFRKISKHWANVHLMVSSKHPRNDTEKASDSQIQPAVRVERKLHSSLPHKLSSTSHAS